MNRTVGASPTPVPLPLAAAAQRRKRAQHRARYGSAKRGPVMRPENPAFQQKVVMLRVEGLSRAEIARVLRVHANTIRDIEQRGEVQEAVTRLREIWRRISQDWITDMAGATWGLAHKYVATESSKDLDNTMRAIAAMEKVSASVSGEGRRLEVQAEVKADARVELKALLAHLFPGTPLAGLARRAE